MAEFKEIQIGENGQVFQVKDETARNNAGGYTPPDGGIPKTDLAPSVQQALDDVANKVDKVDGKGLSTNDYTTAEKTKLQNLPTADQLTQQLGTKANSSDLQNYATKSELTSGLGQKQNTLTFDTTPTAGHTTQVMSSDSIKTAIDLVTPTINENGKWVIGGVTTDKDAQGPRGNTVLVNENAQGIQALIVNNVADGGETDILSAEMGKVIRQNIMRIFNALGTYAFPEGKPVLSWGSTVINHGINTDGVTGGLTISDVEVDGTSVGSLPAQVVEGKSLSFKLSLPSNVSARYYDVSIKMDGNEISSDSNVWNPNTGLVTISSVLGEIVVTATCMVDIEYLESTGTQAIQTGFYHSQDFKCEIKAKYTALTAWQEILGAFNTNAASEGAGKRAEFAINASGKAYMQFGGNYATLSSTSPLDLHTYTLRLVNQTQTITADGETATGTNQTAVNCPLPLAMFASKRIGNFYSFASGRIYYCKLWNSNVLERDFVPVRIGQTGYMYDNVSGELFGNDGTGSFVLGNDVTIE